MMKKLLYGLVCCCSLAYGQNQDTSDVLMLNDDWSFSQVGTEKWLPATVPGTVHQDLIHHKLLLIRSMGPMKKRFSGWRTKIGNIKLVLSLQRNN